MNKLKGMLGVLGIVIFMAGCNGSRTETVTMETLLDELTSYDMASQWPDGKYVCLQTSSHDRRSVAPGKEGWFANDDGFGFVRTDTIQGRMEKVLMEGDGPGAITRIWLTTQDPRGTMRFYLDGDSVPAWTIGAYDLMQFGIAEAEGGLILPHTSYEKGVKGGSTLFLPIPYARGCRVTLEEPEGMIGVPHYYHFNFRRYGRGTRVETFSADIVRRYASHIAEVNRLLQHPDEAVRKDFTVSAERLLQPGDTLHVSLPQGENEVTRAEFLVECDTVVYEQTMRQLLFTADFDGRQTVAAPLSDFSGGGMGSPAVESWYLSADGRGRVVSRWPMPYRKTAELKVCNISDNPCTVRLGVETAARKWDRSSLYFHTSWKQECGLPFNKWDNGQRDWNFTTLHGRGVYRGDVLSLFNHSRLWYGEGDEKIYVDGERFPSHFGTGVEDYYNSSWAPVHVFSTPFGGAPRADMHTSQGYNTFFRTRNLDGIPFGESLRFDMEMMGWLDGKADYATTVFWYGDKDAVPATVSGTEEMRRSLPPRPADPTTYRTEGAVEFERLEPKDKDTALEMSVQGMLDFHDDLWSGAQQALGKHGRPGSRVEYDIEVPEAGVYDIDLYLTQANDYARLRITAAENRSLDFDGYAATVRRAGPLTLTGVPVSGRRLRMRIEITGKNEASRDYLIGLDCIVPHKKQ